MRYYGRTKKNPAGVPEDTTRCVVEIKDRHRSSCYHQCTYPRLPTHDLCHRHLSASCRGKGHLCIPPEGP